ncbi:hypothetical protein [Limimaricola cinnabarinus]|uniref:Carbohydrate kinase FGGY N-terminal domain-containing protein n=1 Tax=Limimaricola cinnabarinus LL-001 TaxID=1337093 RepID=U2Z6Q6_9RHOB|nr:hypothetical protein [Limimaricola cinnabarinus]GAD56737.1 hypothetical protein MBELCI_2789 [Limimaricola cinnabarinus LL-001]
MSRTTDDLIIGIDAGTSVIKAVGFDLAGRQLASAAVPNRYETGSGGIATHRWQGLGRIARRR